MDKRDIEFEWSAQKAKSNLKKHGVSFNEAKTVFDDEHAYIFDDETHSDDEPRELVIGYSNRNRLLIVSFIERLLNYIRIISARKANRSEHTKYEEEKRF